jgi:uncharacterized protein (DUF1800 family)
MADQLTSQITHLYRRAAFGARPEEVSAGVARGYVATVDYLLDRARQDASAVPAPVLPVLPGNPSTGEERKQLNKARNEQEQQIVDWWLEQMTMSEQGATEKLTFFWHDHFATSAQKVNGPDLMLAQNQLFRKLGGGNFETLAQAMAKDGAMMIWLDSNKNQKGKPNENFARELMELFTVGIGNYTDEDVREAARAFTGWRFNRQGGFQILKGQHDNGSKTVLGTTGPLGGEEVVSLLCRQPAAARFIAAKMWRQYAYPLSADHPVISELAAGFAKDGDVSKLLRTVLLHPQFQSREARLGLVKQPIEWVIGAMRQLDVRPSLFDAGKRTATVLSNLNQLPLFPPSVGGWPDNGYWISTTTALTRMKFALELTAIAKLDWLNGSDNAGRLNALSARLGVDEWTSGTAASITQAGNPRQQLAAALVSPEYVLN